MSPSQNHRLLYQRRSKPRNCHHPPELATTAVTAATMLAVHPVVYSAEDSHQPTMPGGEPLRVRRRSKAVGDWATSANKAVMLLDVTQAQGLAAGHPLSKAGATL